MILSRDDISLIHTYLLGNIPLHPSLQKAYTLTQTFNADIRKIVIPFAQNRFHNLASHES